MLVNTDVSQPCQARQDGWGGRDEGVGGFVEEELLHVQDQQGNAAGLEEELRARRIGREGTAELGANVV